MAFLKMHGLGNDFVVLDGRMRPFVIDAATARAITDRHTGIGCDQLIVLDAPRTPDSDVLVRFYNADGSEAGACGNGTRCIARLLMAESGRDRLTIETAAGLLQARAAGPDRVSVDMGPARLDWQAIPLAQPCDSLHLPLSRGVLADPVGVSMGNPHAVFFVPDATSVPIAELGPLLEHDPLFPERANIGVASLIGPDHLRLRVWERGAGLTLACGSGACAAGVAAIRRGLTGRRVTIDVDGDAEGGQLQVEWLENGHVLMTGPVALSFQGELSAALSPAPAAQAAA